MRPEDKSNVSEIEVLGYIWNVGSDNVSVKPPNFWIVSENFTKRRTLKEVAELFDPLGFFVPVILPAKVFIQNLWKKNLNWDDELDENDKWTEIQNKLKKVPECEIPRHIGLISERNNTEKRLLCFCDASCKAYAAVIYLHQRCGNISRCDLIFSKAKLSPIKELTIPKLELMAVSKGVRCLNFVRNELDVQIEKLVLWSHSQCVLQWISTTKKDLNVFFTNRIKKFRSFKDIDYLYVSSSENPADIATRVISVSKIMKSTLWWHGPEWLKLNPCEWNTIDSSEEKTSKCEPDDEVKENVLCSEEKSMISARIEIDIEDAKVYLSTKERFSGKYLVYEEIKEAVKKWIQFIQRKHYQEVFECILQKRWNNLHRLFISDTGILCCKGRLEHADITESSRLPVILPHGEDFTRLLIEKNHKEVSQWHITNIE